MKSSDKMRDRRASKQEHESAVHYIKGGKLPKSVVVWPLMRIILSVPASLPLFLSLHLSMLSISVWARGKMRGMEGDSVKDQKGSGRVKVVVQEQRSKELRGRAREGQKSERPER